MLEKHLHGVAERGLRRQGHGLARHDLMDPFLERRGVARGLRAGTDIGTQRAQEVSVRDHATEFSRFHHEQVMELHRVEDFLDGLERIVELDRHHARAHEAAKIHAPPPGADAAGPAAVAESLPAAALTSVAAVTAVFAVAAVIAVTAGTAAPPAEPACAEGSSAAAPAAVSTDSRW